MTIYDDEVVEDEETLVLTLVSLDQNAFVTVSDGSDNVTVHIVEDSNDCEFSKNQIKNHLPSFKLSKLQLLKFSGYKKCTRLMKEKR